MNIAQVRDTISMLYGPPMTMMSDCIRGMLIADEGYELIACDFSAIEARGLAWLAGEEKVLEIFRGEGKLYEHTAAGIYGIDPKKVDPNQRQIGKVASLALGYGGGVGAFQTMASGYGVKVPDKEAEKIKNAWRNDNQNIVGYWGDLENAAIEAIANPGLIFKAGPPGREVKYKMNGSFLFCLLPSGRMISYPYARLDDFVWVKPKGVSENKRRMLLTQAIAEGFECESQSSKGITYMSENSLTRKWSRETTYGGSLSENNTQALCRDLLAEGMVRLEDHGYPILAHAHDEAITQAKRDKIFDHIKKVETIMSTNPLWAPDFPISAKGWMDRRYKK